MGVKIGPYLNAELKGITPNSAIYYAKTRQGKARAIKVLPRDIAREEFRITARFDDPHIVKTFKRGNIPEAEEGLISEPLPSYFARVPLGYFSMEFLGEKDIKKELDDMAGGFSAQIVLEQMFAISQALLPFWKEGGFHLDIKPGNIMGVPGRGWVLIDFGSTAKYLHYQNKGKRSSIFTPSCAPPEYLSGYSKPSTRGDFFSMGTTIFRLLFNRPVYGQLRPKSIDQLFFWYRRHRPNNVFPAQVKDPKLLEFFLKACAFDPEKRVSDPDEFMGLLERALERAKEGAQS